VDEATRERIAFNLSVYAVPVIPGPEGTRRPAAIGEPGHLEKLMISAPKGSWPLADRWRDVTG
jgi:hypothetical protein